MTEEMCVVFLNTVDPYTDHSAIPYKLLFGNPTSLRYEYPEIDGFMATPEIVTMVDWTKQHEIETSQGFYNMYDAISDEAKNYLDDIGAMGKEGLYVEDVKPMIAFYHFAYKNGDSIVFV